MTNIVATGSESLIDLEIKMKSIVNPSQPQCSIIAAQTIEAQYLNLKAKHSWLLSSILVFT